jgi:hypothetical protein
MSSRLPSTRRSARASVCALFLAALLALAGAGAPSAVAASLGTGGALSKLTEEPPEETETKTATSTGAASTETTHNSSSLLLLGGGAAVVLLAGIVFLIMRDVRGVVPATDGELFEGSTPRHSEEALRRRRAKAKAARRQRKRNR